MMHIEQAMVVLKEIVIYYRCAATLVAEDSDTCKIVVPMDAVPQEIRVEIQGMSMRRGLQIIPLGLSQPKTVEIF